MSECVPPADLRVCAKCGSALTEVRTYTTGVCPQHGIQPTIGGREYTDWHEPAPADLREQVARAIEPSLAAAHHYGANVQQRDAATERVLAVFAERERVLRSCIEALPTLVPWGISAAEFKTDVLGVFDA